MHRSTRNSPSDLGDQASLQHAKTEEFTPLTVRIPVAVRMTGIGRSKLYELIASGDIEIVKIGSAMLIPVASLKALIDRYRR